MIPKETLDAILALNKPEIQFGRPDTTNGESIPFVVIPQSQKVESLEELFPPARIKRTVNLLEAGSFIEYVNRFKTANTLIFANVSETGANFTAMLDYHGAAPDLKPAYCAHVAKFEAVETPEWKIWKAANRKPMNQVDFATFLEDNQSLFVEPTGADLLELVRTLHGHRNARFNTALRLDNGSYSVSYDEDVVVKGTSTAKSGEMELPPLIQAGLAVFQGADAYKVSARLKSRCEDRRLVLFFETVALHQIVRESIMLLVKQISEGTKIVPMLGNA
jgi:uncharacterized protein YfdQ (DUF2303 family)